MFSSCNYPCHSLIRYSSFLFKHGFADFHLISVSSFFSLIARTWACGRLRLLCTQFLIGSLLRILYKWGSSRPPHLIFALYIATEETDRIPEVRTVRLLTDTFSLIVPQDRQFNQHPYGLFNQHQWVTNKMVCFVLRLIGNPLVLGLLTTYVPSLLP